MIITLFYYYYINIKNKIYLKNIFIFIQNKLLMILIDNINNKE